MPKILRQHAFDAWKILRPKNWFSALLPTLFFFKGVVSLNIHAKNFEEIKSKKNKADKVT
jgi:hypothetical protein